MYTLGMLSLWPHPEHAIAFDSILESQTHKKCTFHNRQDDA